MVTVLLFCCSVSRTMAFLMPPPSAPLMVRRTRVSATKDVATTTTMDLPPNSTEAPRRSRLYRLEASTLAQEEAASKNATRIAELGAKLESLSSHEALGGPARDRVANLTSRVDTLREGMPPVDDTLREEVPPVAAAKKAKVRVGDVLTGRCVELRPFGCMISFGDDGGGGVEDKDSHSDPERRTSRGGRTALLHKSEISGARVEDVGAVIPLGSTIKCAVVSIDEKFRLAVSTKALERFRGAMLVDAEKVYAEAPERVKVAPKEAPQMGKKRRQQEAKKVASSVVSLAVGSSLDDIDRQIASIEEVRRRGKARYGTQKRKADAGGDAVEDTLSIAAAFKPPKADVEQKQRDQEFELMMRDMIYRDRTPQSLSDLGAQWFGGRKAKGSFASPFWERLFPPEEKDLRRDDDVPFWQKAFGAGGGGPPKKKPPATKPKPIARSPPEDETK